MDNFIGRKKRPCPGTGEGDVNVSQTAQPIVKQQRIDTAEAASAVIKEYPKADNFVDDIPFMSLSRTMLSLMTCLLIRWKIPPKYQTMIMKHRCCQARRRHGHLQRLQRRQH